MTAQTWDPAGYARHASFVAVNGESLIEWLAPIRGERILDLGCGDGRVTAKLVEAGCGVVGVDSSPEQVAVAKAAGLDARVLDGAELAFLEEFDGVFSNAALHWMKRADAVVAGVHRSLKPGGRFVAEMGGAGNVAVIRTAIHEELRSRGIDPLPLDPWYFPSPEEYRGKLETAGFEVLSLEHFPRPTRLLTDVTGWLATFAGSFTAALPATDRPEFLAAVQRRAEPAMRKPDGSWWLSDYTRLRFAAVKAFNAV